MHRRRRYQRCQPRSPRRFPRRPTPHRRRFVAVFETIVVAVRIERLCAGFDFLAIVKAIAIRIELQGAGRVIEHLVAIRQAVIVGVFVERIGAEAGFLGVREAVVVPVVGGRLGDALQGSEQEHGQ